MTGRFLLLSVALVANVSVLVICAAETSSASASSSASATSEGSPSTSSRASSQSRSRANSKKCRGAEVCPKHERYSECIQAECRILDCNQKGQPVLCPRINPDYCIQGCVCQEGNLRNENGICVPESECETQITCGKNEYLVNCSATCTSDYCPKSADEEQTCVQSDPCKQECKCRFNYRRTDNKTCIPTTSCPPFDCSDRINEEYNPCPPLCPTDDCSLARVKGQCPYRIGIVLECNPKCQCKKGFGRVGGICVPYDKCPNLCSSNEEYSTCIQRACRPQNCSDRDNILFCPAVDEASCKGGCVCKKGYYRNEKGICVSYNECGAQITCGENEILVNCSATCTSDYCPKSADEEQTCVQSDPCKQECKCRFNYRRTDNKTCIPTTSCPPFDCSDRINEEYNPCPPLCPTDDCSLARVKGQCPYRIGIVLECNPKCQCKKGFGRVGEICVPYDKCPNLCQSNEEYSTCIQALCRPQNCSDRDTILFCPEVDEASCEGGCVCKEKYYRDENGDCVSYDECGVCGPHEEIRCVQSCPPEKTCLNRDIQYSCLQVVEPCKNKCVCKKGLVRNAVGDCVTIAQCEPNCPGKNGVSDSKKSCPPDTCG